MTKIANKYQMVVLNTTHKVNVSNVRMVATYLRTRDSVSGEVSHTNAMKQNGVQLKKKTCACHAWQGMHWIQIMIACQFREPRTLTVGKLTSGAGALLVKMTTQ